MSDELVRGTTSLCSTCKRSIDPSIWRRGGRIVMRKRCPQHGSEDMSGATVVIDGAV